MTGTVMGIDPGSRRVGVAVSDAEGKIAFPLAVIAREDDDSYVDQLANLARLREVSQIVVGLPTRQDGTDGPEAVEAMRLAALLRKVLDLPVTLLDERFTTRIAEEAMRSAKVSARKQRPVVDKVAATLLLQNYLDSQSRAGPETGSGDSDEGAN